MGLISVNSAGNAIMRVETTPVMPNGENRSSVRIETTGRYNIGTLIVIDAVHMPAVCGAWPAFWTVGPENWPTQGEIDIIEGVHTSTQNTVILSSALPPLEPIDSSQIFCSIQMSIHTAPGCTMPPNYGASSSLTASTNCDAVATGNTGCGLRSSQANNYGQPYNNNGGGVHIS